MTVAVWSLDIEADTYVVNPSSIRTIRLHPIKTIANIVFEQEVLREEEHILVTIGWVVGVALPAINTIPIIGHDSKYGEHLMNIRIHEN